MLKDRQCQNPDCPGTRPLFRSIDHRVPRLKAREYGLDIVCYVGKRYAEDKTSFPQIYRELTEEFGVIISPRHVPNLFRLFLALVHCRDGDVQVVRERLREQGELVLQVDAIKLDDTTPALYVIRDVLSEEILFSERIDSPSADNLVSFLRRVLTVGVPVSAILTDKERALVLAVERVFPNVPHQICQTHYLKNIVKPMEQDLARLSAGVSDVVREVRELEQKIDRRGASKAGHDDPAETDIAETQTVDSSEGSSDDAAPGKSSESDEAEETKIAKMICSIVKTTGRCRGDKLVDPPALKRYERLTEVIGKLREALAWKKNRWPLLAQLLTILVTLESLGELARRLQLQRDIVRHIAHILHMDSTGQQVKRVLRTYLNRLEREAPRRGRGAARGGYIDEVVAVSNRFWKGLFACYDHAHLPPNNNDLERFFGSLRQHQRRVHGRKSTSGGPLEALAPIFLEAWNTFGRDPDILALLEGIPPEEVKKAQEALANLAEPARLKRSIARDPMAHLEQALSAVRQR